MCQAGQSTSEARTLSRGKHKWLHPSLDGVVVVMSSKVSRLINAPECLVTKQKWDFKDRSICSLASRCTSTSPLGGGRGRPRRWVGKYSIIYDPKPVKPRAHQRRKNQEGCLGMGPPFPVWPPVPTALLPTLDHPHQLPGRSAENQPPKRLQVPWDRLRNETGTPHGTQQRA